MKNLKFKYRSFSKAIVMMILFVFGFTTFASDCYNCVCSVKQDTKKELNCCSVYKKMNCCGNKENKCETQTNKGCDNCNKCIVKKGSIETPITNSDSKISNLKVIQIIDENLSLTPDNTGLISFNIWPPHGTTCRIYLALSNFRI